MKSIDRRMLGAVIITLLVCGSFAATVLLTYVFFDGWRDSERWAHFGDYFNGVLGPVIAFANLILLVIISYQLAAREDARNKYPIQLATLLKLESFFRSLPRPIGELDNTDLEIYFHAHENMSLLGSEINHVFQECRKESDELAVKVFYIAEDVKGYFRAQARGVDPAILSQRSDRLFDSFMDDLTPSYLKLVKSMKDAMA